MIQIKNLSKSFDKKILDNVNIEIEDGSIVGLIGINGAGKSTLFKILAGIYDPDEGEVLYDGESIHKNPKIKKQVFFLSDDPRYSKSLTPAKISKTYSYWYDYSSVFVEFYRHLTKFNIPIDGSMYDFSKGMRRQTFLAFAISAKPKFLLLDEAFDGIDPVARFDLKKEILKIQDKVGMTVILSSHSIKELEELCDSYIIIDKNKATYIQSLEEFPYHKYFIVFDEPMSKEEFDIDFIAFDCDNKIINCVTDLDYDSMKKKIASMNPKILEEQDMSFEDSFITKVGMEDIEK